MYEFIREKYTTEECRAYLKRMGINENPQDLAKTKETLDRLIFAHQCAVPFENLDLYHNPTLLPIDKSSLFEKVVLRNRGGFCFELNGAFAYLLRGLGFDAYSCACRVIREEVTDLGPLFHRGTIVRLNGKKYFCDVGFGGPMAPFAVEISRDRQSRQGKTYWVEETFESWKMEMRLDEAGNARGVLVFAELPLLDLDFIPNCTAVCSGAESHFVTQRMVSRQTETGFIDLTNNTFTINKNGISSRSEVVEEDIPQILKEYFQIELL